MKDGMLPQVLPDALHIIVIARSVATLHGDGGLERHVSDLVRHVLNQGARVTLITRRPSNGNALVSTALPPGAVLDVSRGGTARNDRHRSELRVSVVRLACRPTGGGTRSTRRHPSGARNGRRVTRLCPGAPG